MVHGASPSMPPPEAKHLGAKCPYWPQLSHVKNDLCAIGNIVGRWNGTRVKLNAVFGEFGIVDPASVTATTAVSNNTTEIASMSTTETRISMMSY
jgi:hypothetical protein